MSHDESMWIESHQTLGRHPKVLRLSKSLGIPKPQAIGHLHLLWWWTLDFSPSGDLSKFEPFEISSAAEWISDTCPPERFFQILKDCGWVDENGFIHDWDDYAGKLLRKREVDAERKKAARSSGIPSDIRGTSNGSPSDGAGTVPNQPNLPNITVPNRAEQIEDIYQLYPLKCGKPAALKAIRAAIMRGATENVLKEKVKLYAATITPEDFIPHPSKWFNDERYNDDPKTWTRRQCRVVPQSVNRNIGNSNENVVFKAGKNVIKC